jgi:long-chain acyl-CoA synthetase
VGDNVRTDGEIQYGPGILRDDVFVPLAELEARVARAVGGLHELGVRPGDTVGLLLRNDHEFFEASYAASTLGAAPVPVNWHGTADEVGHVLTDAKVKVLVAHADLLRAVREVIPEGVHVLAVATPPEIAAQYHVDAEHAAVPEGVETWAQFRDRHEPLGATEAVEASSMIYTSGTTGRPKGVRRLPGTNDPAVLVDYLIDVGHVFGLWPGMRTVMTGPMYHSAPNTYGLAAGRSFGGFVVLQSRFDPEELLRLVERHRITSLHMVPTMFVRLLRLAPEVRERYDLSSLTHVVHAAAPCPPDVKRQMIDWLGPIIFEYYGGTESGIVVGCTAEEWLAHPGTVGRPLHACTVRIMGEAGEMPTGEPGEVFMRAAGVPDFTYEGRHEARTEVEREGLITLGDVGFVDEDGFLYLCDRVRDMIISGGVNIYPIEIEACLLKMPGVVDCAVFGVPDDEFGEAIAAAIQPAPGVQVSAEAVREHVREHLAGFKVPQLVTLHDQLPREDSGKIFKRKLRAPYWEAAGRAI